MSSGSASTGRGPYRSAGGFALVELTLGEVRELFNTLDPAPFRRKDLDADAEAYIVGAMRELGSRQPVKLVVYLPAAELALARSGDLVAAIHNYFAYRADRSAASLRQLLMRGLASTLIAFAFMFVCLWLRQAIAAWPGSAGIVLREGLLILGWVALWRPTEIFLYDWWPIWQQERLLRRLADLPVELAERSAGAPADLRAP